MSLASEMSTIARTSKANQDANAEYQRIKQLILEKAEAGYTEVAVKIMFGENVEKLVHSYLNKDEFMVSRNLNGYTVIKW